MNLTFADICLITGTLSIHWLIGSFFYEKIKKLSKH